MLETDWAAFKRLIFNKKVGKMWRSRNDKCTIDEQEKIIASLKDELARYKHAFETTAADRDRIIKLLEDTHGDAPKQLAGARKDESALDGNVASFGTLWGGVRNLLKKMKNIEEIDQSLFEEILKYGWFSQFTMELSPVVIDQLVDWYIDVLDQIGVDLDGLPTLFQESDIMPAYALRSHKRRKVSIDFLRFLVYSHVIQKRLKVNNQQPPKLILEIGSGYGGLARLLKLAYPKATICLVDIPECLRAAEYFIKRSLPDADVIWGNGNKVVNITETEADFYLVSTDKAHSIIGQNIDIVINIWSLGEMPNSQIQTWFDLIQKNNNTSYIFLLNHFMAPVPLQTHALEQHARQYNWMRCLDRSWRIEEFVIDPIFECPPSVLHKHRGVLIYAKRLKNETELDGEVKLAEEAVRDVHLYDWASGSVAWETPCDYTPRQVRNAILTRPTNQITSAQILVLDQFSQMLGLRRPDNLNTDKGAFFRLWNHYRLTENVVSLRLLRIWLYLQWRPSSAGADGKIVETIFREELHFSVDQDGNWIDDPCLLIPEWLRARVVPIKGSSA